MAVAEKRSLIEFYKCPFYWGKIDRKEAEAILKNQPNGSYLWKDPDQINQNETSVEFAMKKNSKFIYGKINIGQRSKIKHMANTPFSPQVIFLEEIVFMELLIQNRKVGSWYYDLTEKFNLLEKTMEFIDRCKKYSIIWSQNNPQKPCSELTFLKNPVLRNRPFSLTELARTKICNSGITYEGISKLEIPKVLQDYLQETWVKKEILKEVVEIVV